MGAVPSARGGPGPGSTSGGTREDSFPGAGVLRLGSAPLGESPGTESGGLGVQHPSPVLPQRLAGAGGQKRGRVRLRNRQRPPAGDPGRRRAGEHHQPLAKRGRSGGRGRREPRPRGGTAPRPVCRLRPAPPAQAAGAGAAWRRAARGRRGAGGGGSGRRRAAGRAGRRGAQREPRRGAAGAAPP